MAFLIETNEFPLTTLWLPFMTLTPTIQWIATRVNQTELLRVSPWIYFVTYALPTTMTSTGLKEYIRTLPFAQRPVTIQSIETRPSTTNHSYRDYSKVPPPPGYVPPTDIHQMSFAEKVHHILSQPKYEHSISWRVSSCTFVLPMPRYPCLVHCWMYL